MPFVPLEDGDLAGINDNYFGEPGNGIYVLKAGAGVTTLGFDVCAKRTAAYCAWVGPSADEHRPLPEDRGTVEGYRKYVLALAAVRLKYKATGEQCPAELESHLIGLEGRRVEVSYESGGDTVKERFWVSKSTGFIPIHLAIHSRRSSGGPAAYVPEGAKIRVIYEAGVLR